MDPIRHEFIEQIRPYRDRPDIVKRIWWYEALPGAKWLGVQSAFSNPIYGDRRFKPHVGLNFTFEPTHHPLCLKHAGQRWVGSAENWANGVLTTDPPDPEPCPCISPPGAVDGSGVHVGCIDEPICWLVAPVHVSAVYVTTGNVTQFSWTTWELGYLGPQAFVCNAGTSSPTLEIALAVEAPPFILDPTYQVMVFDVIFTLPTNVDTTILRYLCPLDEWDWYRGGTFTYYTELGASSLGYALYYPSSVSLTSFPCGTAVPYCDWLLMSGTQFELMSGDDFLLIELC